MKSKKIVANCGYFEKISNLVMLRCAHGAKKTKKKKNKKTMETVPKIISVGILLEK